MLNRFQRRRSLSSSSDSGKDDDSKDDSTSRRKSLKELLRLSKVTSEEVIESPIQHKASPSTKSGRYLPLMPAENDDPARPQPKPTTLATEVQSDLIEADVHILFSGAPQFSVQPMNGTKWPVVRFPWDEKIFINDASDYRLLDHPSLSLATLKEHIHGLVKTIESGFSGYDTVIQEVPSMLSARGVEPGTLGYEYFLQVQTADPIADDQESEPVGRARSTFMRNRRLLSQDPMELGLRNLSTETLVERLASLSKVYHYLKDEGKRGRAHEPGSVASFNDLFEKILHRPRFTASEGDDPINVKVPVEALIKVLSLPGIWYDFRYVNRRIQLGHLLWPDVRDNEESTSNVFEERRLLLLQIVLSCELLLRLDNVVEAPKDVVLNDMHLKERDTKAFRNLRSNKVDWDLVLARRFFDSVTVSLSDGSDTSLGQIRPRHLERQLTGLLHFANGIEWPRAAEVEARAREVAKSLMKHASIVKNPKSGPEIGQSGYLPPSSASRTGCDLAHHMVLEHIKNPGSGDCGWLTKSWLVGLVLPGKPVPALLMAALLENDSEALNTIESTAVLTGGFAYMGRSWWSRDCVVGRVLAPIGTFKESGGWIMIPHAPRHSTHRWIRPVTRTLEDRRGIADAYDVDYDSSLLAGKDAHQVLASALIIPQIRRKEQHEQKPDIRFDHFSLKEVIPEEEKESLIASYEVDATFSFNVLGQEQVQRTFALKHDVAFVPSHPCHPPRRTQMRPIQRERASSTEFRVSSHLEGHPLHKSFKFTFHAVTSILRDGFPDDDGDRKHVFILNARGTPHGEALARSWCSERGYDALIAREQRTCLGCVVREARALGIRIVIWLAPTNPSSRRTS